MEKETHSGVEQGLAAGDQVDYEQLLFGDGSVEDPGVEEGDAADPEQEQEASPEEPGEETGKDPRVEEAFAKRLKQKEQTLREEIRTELMREFEATKNTPAQQQRGAPPYRGLSDEEVEKLADDLEASPKLVRAFVDQQMRLNQTEQMLRQNTQRDQNRVDYNDGVEFAKSARKNNPDLPDWDDQAMHKIRMEHYQRHGTILPWREAYQIQVARTVVSGDLTRQAQQSVINQIKERDKTTVGLKSPAPQKLDVWDIPGDQWERMKADAASGKYARQK